MNVVDSRQIPLFLLWILCLFVASKTLTRSEHPNDQDGPQKLTRLTKARTGRNHAPGD